MEEFNKIKSWLEENGWKLDSNPKEYIGLAKSRKRIWQVKDNWQTADLNPVGPLRMYQNHCLQPTLIDAIMLCENELMRTKLVELAIG
jgi:hypothetical protein